MLRPLGNHTNDSSRQLRRICIKQSMLFSFQCFTSLSKRRQHTIKENTLDMYIVKKGKYLFVTLAKYWSTKKYLNLLQPFQKLIEIRHQLSVMCLPDGIIEVIKEHFSFTFSSLQCMLKINVSHQSFANHITV